MMTKVKPYNWNGVEYIHLSHLPFDQYQTIVGWLPSSSFLQNDKKNPEWEDCVYYKDYEFWFDHKYLNMESPEFDF